MKLAKLKFARLIGIITDIASRTLSEDEIDVIDHIIDVDVTPVEVPGKANPADLDELMRAIQRGQKIEAIKAYRSLTGFGLKEAKDAVEKEWNSKQEAMIKSIDNQLSGVPLADRCYVLEKFNSDQLKLVKEFIKSFYWH